ncbi:hypothetical protein V7147_09285 [Bacillus sp. JJ1521]
MNAIYGLVWLIALFIKGAKVFTKLNLPIPSTRILVEMKIIEEVMLS